MGSILLGVIMIGVFIGLFVRYFIMPIAKWCFGDGYTFSILPICVVVTVLLVFLGL